MEIEHTPNDLLFSIAFDGLVPTSDMVWKSYIVKQFDIINRSTTKESDVFGAYTPFRRLSPHGLLPDLSAVQAKHRIRGLHHLLRCLEG